MHRLKEEKVIPSEENLLTSAKIGSEKFEMQLPVSAHGGFRRGHLRMENPSAPLQEVGVRPARVDHLEQRALPLTLASHLDLATKVREHTESRVEPNPSFGEKAQELFLRTILKNERAD